MRRRETERGIALVVVVMAMLILMAGGAGLALATAAETHIAAAFRVGQQALYAAEAAAEWALADLMAAVPDWATLFAGDVVSPFVDGPPSGTRTLPDGSVLDLSAVVAGSPAWRPYAFGTLAALAPPSARASPFYILVFVAPDGTAPERLKLRTEAFGPRGAHRALELTVLRGATGARFEAWREAR